MDNYTIVGDFWEANYNLDEITLYNNGVRGAIIRMNDTVDREHLDENFVSQWKQSDIFYRMPYFVFGDWFTPIQQYDFAMSNMPPEAKAIGLDVEVDAYTVIPHRVADDLYNLLTRFKNAGLKTRVYSGSWWWIPKHIDTGEAWEDTQEYWWAAYPYLFQPNNTRTISTWKHIKDLISQWTWDTGEAPGPCSLRQICSRYILEGTGNINIDVNIFNGNELQLKDYFGGIEKKTMVEQTITSPHFSTVNLVADQNIRSGPSINATSLGKVIIDGKEHPVLEFGGTDVWIRTDQGWVAYKTSGNTYQKITAYQV
jgi:hypothetical protein